MIHSLLTVIYEAAFKQCTKPTITRSDSNTNPSTVAIGITPESSSVM